MQTGNRENRNQRWIYISFFGLIFAVIAVSIYLNSIAADLVQTNREQSLKSTLSQLSSTMEAEFARFNGIVRQVQADPEIRQMLKSFPVPDADSTRREQLQKRINDRLSIYASGVRDITGLHLIGFLQQTQSYQAMFSLRSASAEQGINIQIDPDHKAYFDRAIVQSSVTHWIGVSEFGLLRKKDSNTATIKGYNGPTFTLLRNYGNIKGLNGEDIFIVMNLSDRWFGRWLGQFSEDAGLKVYVTDASRKILFASEASVTGTNLNDPSSEMTNLETVIQENGWRITIRSNLQSWGSDLLASQTLLGLVLLALAVMSVFALMLIRRFQENQQQISDQSEKLRMASDDLKDRNQLLEDTSDQLSMRNAQLEIQSLELEDSNRQLSRILKIKDQILANTSHELRTPLNGIIGLTESLIEGVDTKPTAVQQENLEMILQSAGRLKYQIDQILDFAKLRGGDMRVTIQNVKPDDAVLTVMSWVEAEASVKGLPIVVTMDDNLPDVLADPKHLTQMLHQLLVNAIKFTHYGRIDLWVKYFDQHVRFSVQDTGIGMSEEQIAHLYEGFEQGDGSSERQYGGIGIGLAIVRRLVELCDGQLTVDSDAGVGSIFTLAIPAAQPKIEEEKHMLEMEKSNVRCRVMVVDDEPVNIQVLRNHLSKLDLEVVTSTSGRQVLDKLEAGERFDLMLVDLMMPFMSGYELCEKVRLRFNSEETPIIVLSAKPLQEDEERAYACGANAFLLKPFSRDSLLQTIQKYTASRAG